MALCEKQVAEDEDRETEDDLDEEDEEYDSGGSGVAMTPPGAFSNILSEPVVNVMKHMKNTNVSRISGSTLSCLLSRQPGCWKASSSKEKLCC